MNCPKCQNPNSVENVFCVSCGEPLQVPTGDKTERFSNLSLPSTPTILKDSSNNLSGKTLDGKYQLEAKLGEGGMGAVYLATRLHIGDKVAVKVLHTNKMNDPTAGERFRREVQMAAQLKHPNVIGIYDYGMTQDGLHYIVMELIEGRTLRQLISKQGVLPLSIVSNITSQVCAALNESHRKGLIHRDIKPDNISVHETPDGLRVKVLDFGIAKLQEGSSNLTQTDTIVGTPRYMSPEQCSGERLSGSSDIYSFGVVLFEMLCGIVPFNAPSSTAVAVQQVTKQPPPLRQINNTIPQQVERVVLRALEKNPVNRPVSASVLAKELNDAIHAGQSFQPNVESSSESFTPAPTVYSQTTSENDSPTVSLPSPTTQESVPDFLVPPNVRPPNQTGSSKKVLILGLLTLVFVMFLGVGGFAWWMLMPSDDDKVILEPPKSIENQTNSKNRSNSNSGDTKTMVDSADEELKTLTGERLKSTPNDINKIDEKLKQAEEKYPNDYRFTYERARLYAPLPKHDKSFDALFESARKAIKNNQASEMLDKITQDTNIYFKRMAVGHKQWTAIINAIRQKDESLLSEEDHQH